MISMDYKKYIKIDDGVLVLCENIHIELKEEWSSLPSLDEELGVNSWCTFTMIGWIFERVGYSYHTSTVFSLLGISLEVKVYDKDREAKIEGDDENPINIVRKLKDVIKEGSDDV